MKKREGTILYCPKCGQCVGSLFMVRLSPLACCGVSVIPQQVEYLGGSDSYTVTYEVDNFVEFDQLATPLQLEITAEINAAISSASTREEEEKASFQKFSRLQKDEKTLILNTINPEMDEWYLSYFLQAKQLDIWAEGEKSQIQSAIIKRP